MDERHAQDIEDIKNTVGHIERKQYEQDARIGRMEGRVEAQDALMNEKYLRLDQKIDGVADEVKQVSQGIKEVNRTLLDHMTQEDEDRRVMIREQRKTFWTLATGLLTAAAGVLFAYFAQGGA